MHDKEGKKRHNVILIGMPGAGKSTVGVVLAKRLGYAFLDSDLVIQSKEGRLLHEMIADKGVEGFWQIEESVNASIEADRTVIATGGSVIYGSRAMEHFKQIGTIVYLKLSLEAIADRLGDLSERGVTLREGQDLAALYEERIPMYERYADIIMDCENLSIREIVTAIAELTADVF
ncbi:MAG: shikimate kinase [Lachnospiraceae bacterium]|nr:shikimate kinase [Lachnospiraceae bacterium]